MRLALTPGGTPAGRRRRKICTEQCSSCAGAGQGSSGGFLFRRAAQRANRPANLAWALHLRGCSEQRWSKLTSDDLDGIAGKRDQLIGKLQELYELNEVHVEAELRDWERHQDPIVAAAAAARR
jgi:uncharacterized protein YjbJ (UPF0337 family)